MTAEGDVAFGILVSPSRRQSEGDHDGRPESNKTITPAHIRLPTDESLEDQLKHKEERIRALEQRCEEMESIYKSQLETAMKEQKEMESTVHLMQTMLDDAKRVGGMEEPKPIAPVSKTAPGSMTALLCQNDDLKFKIQQLRDDKEELKVQMKIANSEARDAERILRKTLDECNDAMDGVDKERVWMSAQLSYYEQQIQQLQNENIYLLNTIQEEKDKREQMVERHVKELERMRQEQTQIVNAVQEEDAKPQRSLFGHKARAKKAQNERSLKLAFITAKAYFDHQQQKRSERYDLDQPLRRDEMACTSLQSSSTTSIRLPSSSSKGQAELLARHMMEKQQPSRFSTMKSIYPSTVNSALLPLTMVDEIKLEKSHQKRQKALNDIIKK